MPTNQVTHRDELDQTLTEFIETDLCLFLGGYSKENNVFPMVPSGSGGRNKID